MHNANKKIIQQYYDYLPTYQSLKDDVEDIITRIIEANHIRISNFSLRIKSEQSLAKKITYKNKYHNIHEITDIVACRIITLFENDIDDLVYNIARNFEVIEYSDKRKKNLDHIDFGYNSLHMLIKFTDERCQLIEYAAYKDIVFELQIRTVLQHSWAEIEHGLGYKSQYEIPKNIRRRLNRLSASLELLDEEFVQISKEVEAYNNGIEHIEKVLKTDINVNSLIQYVNTSPVVNEMLERLHNEYQFEFERDHSLISQSHLIQRYRFLGYLYINELDEFINTYKKEIEWVSRQRIENQKEDHILNIYSILVWVSMVMLIANKVADPEDIFTSDTLEHLQIELQK